MRYIRKTSKKDLRLLFQMYQDKYTLNEPTKTKVMIELGKAVVGVSKLLEVDHVLLSSLFEDCESKSIEYAFKIIELDNSKEMNLALAALQSIYQACSHIGKEVSPKIIEVIFSDIEQRKILGSKYLENLEQHYEANLSTGAIQTNEIISNEEQESVQDFLVGTETLGDEKDIGSEA